MLWKFIKDITYKAALGAHIVLLCSFFWITWYHMTSPVVAACRAFHGRYNILFQTCDDRDPHRMIIPKPHKVGE